MPLRSAQADNEGAGKPYHFVELIYLVNQNPEKMILFPSEHSHPLMIVQCLIGPPLIAWTGTGSVLAHLLGTSCFPQELITGDIPPAIAPVFQVYDDPPRAGLEYAQIGSLACRKLFSGFSPPLLFPLMLACHQEILGSAAPFPAPVIECLTNSLLL